MSEPLVSQVRQTIAEHRLLPAGSRVMAAVSGGPDSVALLHALLKIRAALRLSLRIVHLDHGLRPDSAQDADFVRALGTRWRVPTTIERREVSTTCAREGWSLEDGARRVRYQVLLETARRYSADFIATAHTADDQAETVLMRFIRGAGLMGLGGIPIKRPLAPGVWVVRPLLEREYNPRMKPLLVQLARHSRSDYAYLEKAARRQWKRLVKAGRAAGGASNGQTELAISIPRFRQQPQALQREVVRQAIHQLRADTGQLEFRHWLETEQLFAERPSGAVLDLPGGVQLVRSHSQVICRRVTHPADAASV